MKQVIVVRKDLKMRKGKIAAQVAHGAMGAVLPYLDDPRVTEWLNGIFTKICVSCDSEEELLQLEQQAKDAGLITCLITDSGLTEFHGVPTKTVLAIGPDEDDRINVITGDLKLL